MFEAYAPIGSPGRFFKQAGDPEVMDDPVIKEVAEKHSATPAQVYSITISLHLAITLYVMYTCMCM